MGSETTGDRGVRLHEFPGHDPFRGQPDDPAVPFAVDRLHVGTKLFFRFVSADYLLSGVVHVAIVKFGHAGHVDVLAFVASHYPAAGRARGRARRKTGLGHAPLCFRLASPQSAPSSGWISNHAWNFSIGL